MATIPVPRGPDKPFGAFFHILVYRSLPSILYPVQSLDSMVSRVSSGGRDMRFSRHAVSNALKIRLNGNGKHRQHRATTLAAPCQTCPPLTEEQTSICLRALKRCTTFEHACESQELLRSLGALATRSSCVRPIVSVKWKEVASPIGLPRAART